MPITAKNILKHELIGLEAEVTASTNPSLTGIRGKVMMETKNTLTIGEKTVPKEGTRLVFRLGGSAVRIDGSLLVSRPEDRMKRKAKKW
jgi:ribonuclease P protein subunit POP4